MPVEPLPPDAPVARPAPARPPGQVVAAWLAWVGLTRVLLTAASVALVGAGAYWLLRAQPPDVAAALPVATSTPAGPVEATLPPPATSPSASMPSAPAVLTVHVAGQVVHPGVYVLAPGARVVAAIDMAGGPAADGDLDALNLAGAVVDGQRIYVPPVGVVDPATVAEGGPAPDAGAAASEPAGPLDLNTATAAQLETLPGVGPATARRIVDDRERNGPFASVNDLDRVSGIGPAKLDALRGLVTV